MSTLVGGFLAAPWCLFGLYRLFVAAANALHRERLVAVHDGSELPTISVLVPLRNEAHQLPDLLANLKDLGAAVIEVLLYDDASTDQTAAVLAEAQASYPMLQFFRGADLPLGWLGKNHACWQLAQQSQGRWLLFIDADVRLKAHLPSRALQHALTNKLHMLSLFPQQKHDSWGEALWVPLMHQVLLSYLYLPWVQRSNFSSVAAANGQFLLFERDFYFQLGGHAAVANQLPEDVWLARKSKAAGGKVSVLLADEAVQCSMYAHGWAAMRGLWRNVVPAIGKPVYLWIWLFWQLVSLGALLFFAPAWMLWGLLLPVLSRIFVLLAAEKKPGQQLVLLLPQLLLWPVWYLVAAIAYQTKQIRWKDRPVH